MAKATGWDQATANKGMLDDLRWQLEAFVLQSSIDIAGD